MRLEGNSLYGEKIMVDSIMAPQRHPCPTGTPTPGDASPYMAEGASRLC